MIKTSKIKSVNGEIKPFTNNYGTTYYHNLEMENGDKINIGKKSQCQVGWELTYELTGEDDGQQEFKKAKSAKMEGSDFKPSNSNGGNSDTRQQSIVRQSSLDRAVQYSGQGMNPMSKEQIVELAEFFEAWVNRK